MKVQMIKVGDMDNNAYLLTDETTGKCAIVDPGFESDELMDVVKSVADSLEYILLTHRHYDHILAARTIKELTGAKICIHPKDACGLSSAAFSLAAYLGVTQQALTPDFTFVENDKFKLGETTVFVLYTPGHTIGSVCFLCGDALITGDTLFRLGMGRTDLPTGNQQQMMQSLKHLSQLAGDYKVYPGHGKASTLDIERTCNPFMIEALKL